MTRVSLAAGLAVLAVIWVLPLESMLPGFPAHMLRHMGLVAVAGPLLAIGLPRLAQGLAINPVLAAALEFAVVWGWHLPRPHALARLDTGFFLAEQAVFLVAGFVVWAGCLRARQPLAGAGGLLLTSMHMTFLGVLLILSPRDLYSELCGTAPDVTAQQVGGMLMLALGTPVYLFGGMALTALALAERKPA